MHSAIETWIEDLSELVDEAQASEEFQEWLDVQSRFHDYSYRNTLLIKQQCPEATRVAGYRTWQEEFDRYVKGGERAIWIWAPIITKRCPECENSPSYHEKSDCEYDETLPEGVVEGARRIQAGARLRHLPDRRRAAIRARNCGDRGW